MNLKLSFSFFVMMLLLINCNRKNYASKEINYIPYYLKVYEADSLYITGNYERSFEILDSLFKEYEPINTTYELTTYIKAAYQTENYHKLKSYFELLINTWGFKQSQIEYDSILKLSWDKAGLTEKEVQKLELEYRKKINWELRDTLSKMHNIDQQFRGKKGEDSLDLIHYKKLNKIFKEHGYPDFGLVGNPTIDENSDLGIYFIHISMDLNPTEYDSLKNFILKSISEGKATPDKIAWLEDIKAFYKNQNSIYGTFGTNESWGDKMIKIDTVTINQNRKRVGLPSLQYEKFKQNYFERMYNVE